MADSEFAFDRVPKLDLECLKYYLPQYRGSDISFGFQNGLTMRLRRNSAGSFWTTFEPQPEKIPPRVMTMEEIINVVSSLLS